MGASGVAKQPKGKTPKTKTPKPDFYKEGPNGRVPGYYGLKAVKVLQDQLGRPLSKKEKRVVQEEAYVDGLYYDHKGIVTAGVGQTGEYIKKGFEASVKEHEDRTRRLVPDYDLLDEDTQAELLQSTYRGDLSGSPTAVRLFNHGRYEEAADEFLRHEEYLNPDTPAQIKARIKSVADRMRKQ